MTAISRKLVPKICTRIGRYPTCRKHHFVRRFSMWATTWFFVPASWSSPLLLLVSRPVRPRIGVPSAYIFYIDLSSFGRTLPRRNRGRRARRRWGIGPRRLGGGPRRLEICYHRRIAKRSPRPFERMSKIFAKKVDPKVVLVHSGTQYHRTPAVGLTTRKRVPA